MDQTVTVIGSEHLAEEACRMVFGEDASAGPVRLAPQPLLTILADWPGRTDEPNAIALELPMTFDIEKDMGKDQVKAIVLIACRVTVLHQGKVMGHALRTDRAGLVAIGVWEQAWERYRARLRQAH